MRSVWLSSWSRNSRQYPKSACKLSFGIKGSLRFPTPRSLDVTHTQGDFTTSCLLWAPFVDSI